MDDESESTNIRNPSHSCDLFSPPDFFIDGFDATLNRRFTRGGQFYTPGLRSGHFDTTAVDIPVHVISALQKPDQAPPLSGATVRLYSIIRTSFRTVLHLQLPGDLSPRIRFLHVS